MKNHLRSYPIYSLIVVLVGWGICTASEDEKAAEGLYIKGNFFYMKGNFPGAAEQYTRALKQSPNNPQYLFALAVALAANGDFDSAIEAALRAADIAPQAREPFYLLLALYERSEKHTAGTESIRKLLKKSPKNPAAHYSLGGLLLFMGRLVEARKAMEEALRTNPSYLRAELGLATIDYREGNLKGAEKRARKVLGADPGFAQAHLLLSFILEKQGKSENAAKEREEALRLEPGLKTALAEMKESRGIKLMGVSPDYQEVQAVPVIKIFFDMPWERGGKKGKIRVIFFPGPEQLQPQMPPERFIIETREIQIWRQWEITVGPNRYRFLLEPAEAKGKKLRLIVKRFVPGSEREEKKIDKEATRGFQKTVDGILQIRVGEVKDKSVVIEAKSLL